MFFIVCPLGNIYSFRDVSEWTFQVTETVKVMGDSRDRKMVLVVRNDLKMGKGKIAAQVILLIIL